MHSAVSTCFETKKKTHLTLLRSVLVNVTDTLLLLFQRMPFPKIVVLHFLAEIHRTQGVSEVAPQLLRALGVQKIAAVQFLRNGRVRVTTKTSDYRNELLEGSTFLFGDVPIPVTAADQPLRSVFVRDLPVEVPDVDVKSVFESFGVVHSVHPCFFREFPSVANGTRRLVMSFRGSIPSSASVFEFPVRVFHAGQPVTCSICHESGHLPQDCRFSGLCLRCKQPGHMARNCPQPWGPSSSSPHVPTSSAPVSSPQFVPSSVPFSSSSVPASSIQYTFCHPLLSSPLLCLLLCHLSSLRNLLLLKMERLLCLPIIRKLMPLHHGVLVHVFLLRLIIENLSVLSCQK